MAKSIMWFRRDLRRIDNPALIAAAARGDVACIFVIDPTLVSSAGNPRLAFLAESLRSLNQSLGNALVVRHGDPVEVIPQLVEELGADAVYCTGESEPYGRVRDDNVEKALSVPLQRIASPYAVEPGTIRKQDGNPYSVFTPFYKSWLQVDIGKPAFDPADSAIAKGIRSEQIPDWTCEQRIPVGGEAEAWKRLRQFLEDGIDRYSEGRDVPSIDATSRLSPYLRFGCIHPRSILAELVSGENANKFASEIAWREFYADVLFHKPNTLNENFNEKFDSFQWNDSPELFELWANGRTGYPLVDAGMRQLLTEGWMHNRVRMIVGSFLVKDLHIDWRRGADHFMKYLVDGDPASNQHGWQWVAGTGTDASPYFRVFNPITQSKKFDSDGVYIKTYVPELADCPIEYIHEPWRLGIAAPAGYPEPIVDHAVEREVALDLYSRLK